MTQWPWPLNGVQAWFEDLWNNVVAIPGEAAKFVWQLIPDWIDDAFNFVYQMSLFAGYEFFRFLEDPLTYLGGLADKVWDVMPDWIKDLFNDLDFILKYEWSLVMGFVRDPVGKLEDLADKVWDLLPTWLTDLFNRLKYTLEVEWGRVMGFIRDPVGALRAGWDEVSKAVDGARKGMEAWWDATVTPKLEALHTGLTGIPGEVKTLFDEATGKVLAGFAPALEGVITWLWENLTLGARGISVFLESRVIMPIHEGLQWFLSALTQGAMGVYRQIQAMLRDVNMRIRAGDVGAALELLASFGGLGLAVAGLTSVAGLKVMGTGIEVGELGDFLSRFINPGMFTGIILGAMLSAAVEMPLRQQFNAMFRPYIPVEDQLRTWFLRGYIDEDGAKEILGLRGWRDEFMDNIMKAWWVIPGISDLITFVVREIITPEDFIEWASRQGLSEYWAKNYWEAHWVLPAFGMIRDAFWRDIVTEDEFRKFIVWHDYKPEPRPGIGKSDLDIMAELSWELPTRIDTRWMYEQGAIDWEELERLYRYTGLHPEWVGAVSAATVKTIMRAEQDAVLREVAACYVQGYITKETFLEEYDKIRQIADLKKLFVLRYEWRAFADSQADRLRTVVTAFREGWFTEEQFMAELKKVIASSNRFWDLVEREKYRKKPPG